LLRTIEEKKIRRVGGLADVRTDVRIIAATNRDLQQLANQGRFRLDLLYRLKVLTLTLPPLRERGDDIHWLAEHFINLYARKYDRHPKRLGPDAVAALAGFPWLGNVRELAHVIERAMLLVEADTLEAWHLGLESHLPAEAQDTVPAGAPAPGTLQEVERRKRCGRPVSAGGSGSRADRPEPSRARDVLLLAVRVHERAQDAFHGGQLDRHGHELVERGGAALVAAGVVREQRQVARALQERIRGELQVDRQVGKAVAVSHHRAHPLSSPT